MTCENQDLTKATPAELEAHRQFHQNCLNFIRPYSQPIAGVLYFVTSPIAMFHAERLNKISEALKKNQTPAQS